MRGKFSVSSGGVSFGESFLRRNLAPDSPCPKLKIEILAKSQPIVFSPVFRTLSRIKRVVCRCGCKITERATLTTCDPRPAEAKAFLHPAWVAPWRSALSMSLSHDLELTGWGVFASWHGQLVSRTTNANG